MKSQKLLIVVMLCLPLISGKITAQNVSISEDNSYTPDAAAMLDVYSTNKGMLVPRVALVSTTDPVAITKPNGLLVWNTSVTGTYPIPGFYFWNGTDWVMVGSTSLSFLNGISQSGKLVKLGGLLTETTTITQANYGMVYDLTGTGDFDVQDAGTSAFFVGDNGSVGIGTNSPDSKAVLDVSSTSKGILVPRMSTVQRTAITSPTNGLLVFDTGYNSFFYYNSAKTKWVNLTATIPGTNVNEALFAVVNNAGDTVFAVYPEGVQINVGDGLAKGNKGGFAVSGVSAGKATGIEYFRVSPDSVRIYVEDDPAKATKGGFAVSGVSAGKGIKNEILRVTEDSVRVYFNSSPTKATKGGFAVSGVSAGKGIEQDYLLINQDSARIYVKTDAKGTKATKGGFAVSGVSAGKATSQSLMVLVKENYFIGHEAGIHTTSGLYNSFFGYESGKANTTGTNNVFMGFEAGKANVTGSNNVLIGTSVANQHDFGQYNVLIGTRTANGVAFNGASNVMVGSDCGRNSTTAQKNVFLGDYVGNYNTTGSQNVFIGAESGWSNTTANNNIFLGTKSGYLNETGQNNFFAGTESGYSNTTGDYNLFLGNLAGHSNTTGTGNVYLGASAGNASQTAWQNVFLGNLAGTSFIGGNHNVFIGNEVAKFRLNGQRNIILGNQAGFLAGNGDDNVFIGNQTGYSNNGGGANVFIGNTSGYNNLAGYQNVFIGNQSGYSNTSGRSNVFLGDLAGYSNSTGDYNVFLGRSAGTYNTTGTRNVFLGYESGVQNTTGGQNVFIGDETGTKNTTGSNNVALGYAAGIELSTGSYNLLLGSDAGHSNTTGQYNTTLGTESGFRNQTGLFNTNLGAGSGYSNVSGSASVTLGYQAGYYETNSNRLYIANQGGTDLATGIANSLIYGEFDNKIVRINGGLGIGTSTPIAKIHVYNTRNSWDEVHGILIDQHGAPDNTPFRIRTNTTDPTTYTDADTKFVVKGDGSTGIGTNAPSRLLDVNGTARFRGLVYDYNNSSGTTGNVLTRGASGIVWGNMVATGSGVANKLAYWTDASTISYNTNLHWDNTNNRLGIGVTSPNFALDLAKNTSGVGLRLRTSVAAADNQSLISFAVTTNNPSDLTYSSFIGGERTSSSQDLIFGTAASTSGTPDEKMRILGNGNVGINTKTPLAKLTILGSGTSPAYPGGATSNGIIQIAPSTQEGIDIGKMTTSPFAAWIQVGYSGTNADPLSLQPLGGNVGIGLTNPGYKLTVSGTAWCTSGAWASDQRLKKNINNFDHGTLQKLMQLNAVSFEWENPLDDGMKGTQMGFIAQDVEAIFPSMVLTAGDEEKTKSIKYGEFFPVIVTAIQEQQNKIDSLQNQVNELIKIVEVLKNK